MLKIASWQTSSLIRDTIIAALCPHSCRWESKFLQLANARDTRASKKPVRQKNCLCQWRYKDGSVNQQPQKCRARSHSLTLGIHAASVGTTPWPQFHQGISPVCNDPPPSGNLTRTVHHEEPHQGKTREANSIMRTHTRRNSCRTQTSSKGRGELARPIV